MFLVLIVHFNGWFLGGISEYFDNFFAPNISQAIIIAFSCICVNCFLVITGWFSVKLKVKSIINIASIALFAYLVCAVIGISFYNYSFKSLISAFFVFSRESYYLQCYLMLIVLSPILNSFVEKYGRNILPLVGILLFVEVYIHWIKGNQCLGFMNGYGLTHFIVMYLLGRSAYLYKEYLFHVRSFVYLIIYLSSISIIFLMYLFAKGSFVFSYSNPFNILASFSLFFIFAKMKFVNSFVNCLSISTFMVYMLHISSPISDFLSNILVEWHSTLPYSIYLSYQVVLIIVVFFFGILLDKMRMLIFDPINNYLLDKIRFILTRKKMYES